MQVLFFSRLSGGRQKTAGEYLLGDRSMSEWPVAFSLMASFMSAITLLGVCQVQGKLVLLLVLLLLLNCSTLSFSACRCCCWWWCWWCW